MRRPSHSFLSWIVLLTPALLFAFAAFGLYTRLFVRARGSKIEGISVLLSILAIVSAAAMNGSAAKFAPSRTLATLARAVTPYMPQLIYSLVAFAAALIIAGFITAGVDGFPRDDHPLLAHRNQYLLFYGQNAAPAGRPRFIIAGVIQVLAFHVIQLLFVTLAAGSILSRATKTSDDGEPVVSPDSAPIA